MKSKYQHVLFYLLGIIFISGVYIYSQHRYIIDMYINHEFYSYRYFCFGESEKCLTVMSYNPLKITDNVTKKYVLYGKKNNLFLFYEKYIEYPNDTGIYIEWKSPNKCMIISNQAAIHISQLKKMIDFEIVFDNRLYEINSERSPNNSI